MKLFLDSADFNEVEQWFDSVEGFTSNPAMVAAMKPKSYRAYAQQMLRLTAGKSTSLEVLADEPESITTQALELRSMGDNVVVKVPCCDTGGRSNEELALALEAMDVPVNYTATFTPDRYVDGVTIISLLAGRVGYTGFDPSKVMEAMYQRRAVLSKTELLWAGVRSPYNIYEAERAGADIATVPADSLKRYFDNVNRSLDEFAVQTSREFFAAGEQIPW